MNFRQFFALLLALLMLASPVAEILPANAFAAEIQQETTLPAEEETAATETTETTEAVTEGTTAETTVPETTVPETTVPETTVPETTVPETTVPETTVPETTVPETTVPETTVAETEETTEATEAEEMEEEEEERRHYMEIPDDFTPPFASLVDAGIATSTYYPSYYDARTKNVLPAVRDQGQYGLCWAFSAISMAESHLITNHLANTGIDLSERHLAHFFHGEAYDPLSNATGDSSYLLLDYLECGNNNKFTTFAMANWVGAATEAKYPYYTDPGSGNRYRAMDDVAHLTNAFWINAQDHDSIKHYVMKNGSVGISIYYDYQFYNRSTYGFYNNLYASTNHAISVVGWDDNYSASNFLTRPAGNGAWLCRNSYSSNWGDGGYFWVSYYDEAFNMSGATAIVFEFDSGSNYDWNYHYDGSYGTMSMSLDDGSSLAAVYTASDLDDSDELLEAVGIALSGANIDYSLQIYTDLTNPSKPTSGKAVFDTPQTGTTGLCGYYTIPLKETVTLHNGQTFSVVFTLSSRNDNIVSFFVDYSYVNGDWIEFNSSAEAGQTFYRYPGYEWGDLIRSKATARIKAFTSSLSTRTLSGLHFEETSVQIPKGQTYLQMPIVTPADATECPYTWTTSNTRVAQVDGNGLVTAVGVGSATITVSALDGKVTATYDVVVVPVVESLSFSSFPSAMIVGDRKPIQVQMLPKQAANYYTVELSSSDPGVVRMDGTNAIAVAPGTAEITASANGKVIRNTITVTYSLKNADIIVDDVIFHGDPVYPAVIVMCNDMLLEENVHFTLSYRNNTRPGTGTVIITGMGQFSGTAEKNFHISMMEPELTALETEKKGIRLRWDTLVDAASYTLQRKTGNGKWKTIKTITDPTVAEYLDTGAKAAGTKYSYRILFKIQNDGNSYTSNYSDILVIRRMAAPKISTMKATASGFRLGWKNVSGAQAYQVFRSDNGAEPVYLATVTRAKTTNYYTDITAKEVGVQYTYTVVPEATVNSQTRTGLCSAGRSACIPKPTTIHSVENGAKGIVVTWEAAENASGYEIYRSKNGGNWTKVKTITRGTTTTWTDISGLTGGAEYAYKIRARIKLNGTFFYSDFCEDDAVHYLKQPTISSLKKTTAGIQIKAAKITKAEGFVVYRSVNGSQPELLCTIPGSAALNYVDGSVTAGNRYTYTIAAYLTTADGTVYSALSSQKNILY